MSDDNRPASGADHVTRDVNRAMRLLAEGVPLTLLIDLATPPHSRELLEREPGEADWLVAAS